MDSLPLVRRWARASQEAARRNAMAATTVLLERRAERLEVQAFLRAALTQRAATSPPGTAPTLPRPRREVG